MVLKGLLKIFGLIKEQIHVVTCQAVVFVKFDDYSGILLAKYLLNVILMATCRF